MKDLVLPPCVLNVDTRGVLSVESGNDEFEVSVMVDGVYNVARVGEGGNTKRVCEGVADMGWLSEELEDDRELVPLRKAGGGSSSFLVDTRERGPGMAVAGSLIGVIGDEGTGGRTPTSGGGRRLAFILGCVREGKSKLDRTAVAGTGGSRNLLLCAGAEGGGMRCEGKSPSTLQGEVWRELGSADDNEESSSSVVLAKPPCTPNSSASSSSSTKSSLSTLPAVTTLAIEPARLRLP